MQFEERFVGNVVVLSVTGEITLDHRADVVLKETVQSLIDQGRRQLVIDLEKVTQWDTAGLGQLVNVSMMSKSAGGSVKLLNLTEKLKLLLTIHKLAPLFDVYDNESAAIASFSSTSV